MDDLISRQAVLNKILKFSVTDGGSVSVTGLWTEVNELPSVKPQETGYWILKIEDWCKWTCSECGHTERTDIHVSLGYDFCPKCGVKMEV